MRIALDCSPACGAWTGVGRYAHDLALGLAKARAEVTAVYQGHHGPLDAEVAGACSTARRYDLLGGRIGARFRLPRVLRAAAAAIYHTTSTIAVPGPGWRGAVVATVHDCYPLRPDSGVSARSRRLFGSLLRRVVAAARIVIVPSSASADELRAHVPVPRVEVVHHGIAVASARPPRPPTAPGGGYVLTIGAIEPRKRLDALAEARRGRPDLPPWIHLGPVRHDPDGRIAAAMDGAGCRRLGYVAESERLAWLAHALLLAHPSEHEGFGYPPLEAMALGVPVVAAPCAAMREVLADAAVWVEPRTPSAWAGAISSLASDATARSEAAAAGRRRAERFTIARMVDAHLTVYRDACA